MKLTVDPRGEMNPCCVEALLGFQNGILRFGGIPKSVQLQHILSSEVSGRRNGEKTFRMHGQFPLVILADNVAILNFQILLESVPNRRFLSFRDLLLQPLFLFQDRFAQLNRFCTSGGTVEKQIEYG